MESDWPSPARILAPGLFTSAPLDLEEPVCGSVKRGNVRWFHIRGGGSHNNIHNSTVAFDPLEPSPCSVQGDESVKLNLNSCQAVRITPGKLCFSIVN
jgi:hypothetical protein